MKHFDVIGLGAGPFNISLACLLQPTKLRAAFFERSPTYAWHAGLLFSDAKMQTSYLKDLVTLADPTSYFSFMNYLHKTNRLFNFLNAGFSAVSRVEFNNYLRWAAETVGNINFQHEVLDVEFSSDDNFTVHTDQGSHKAKHIVVGSGPAPHVPNFAVTQTDPKNNPNYFHATDYLHRANEANGKKVVLVGGGQTSAEVFLDLLSKRSSKEIVWISRRKNFLPLDDSSFIDDLYTPNYIQSFYHLPPESRRLLLKEQVLASDGITPDTLSTIYHALYENEFCVGPDQKKKVCLMPAKEVQEMSLSDDGDLRITLNDLLRHETSELHAELAILATGYERKIPSYLKNLSGLFDLDAHQQPQLNYDFSLQTSKIPPSNKVFLQNWARHTHGISAPNLSLMSWRNAVICNAVAGQTLYAIPNNVSFVSW